MHPADWMDYDERQDIKPERIDRAAIRLTGTVYSLPQPARHHHVIKYIVDTTSVHTTAGGVQGFLTNTRRFVDRYEALVIAIRAGQILEKTGPADQLYSEDVW